MNTLLIAAIEPSRDIVDFQTALLLLVTAGLLFLGKMLADLNRRLKEIECTRALRSVEPEVVTPAVASSPASASPEQIPPEILAVIAAAVSVGVEGKPHRIIAITPTIQTWSLEGRRQIFLSHSPR